MHIFPVEGNFYFTDVNNKRDNSIMKIGPDSLGMSNPVSELVSAVPVVAGGSATLRILDLCTGSGVQGINAALFATAKGLDVDLTLVDINPRSRRFVKANLLLNDVKGTWLEGDVYGALPPAPAPFHFILANPPYWPAHNKLLFHAGGPDGERVTAEVVRGGTPLLHENGLMVIVTPIFNPDQVTIRK